MIHSGGHGRIIVGVVTSMVMIMIAASSVSSASTLASSSGGAASLVAPAADSGCPSAACSAVIAAVAAGTHLKTLPANLTPSLADAASDLRVPPGGACGSLQIPGVDPSYEPCVYGSTKATSRIVLLGDSHAWQWATSVASIAQRTGASLGLLYHSSCVVTLTASSLPPNGPPGGSEPSGQVCDQWTKAAIKWINNFHPQTVIVVAYSGDTPSQQPIYAKGLVELFHEVQAPGRQLVLIGQDPDNYTGGPDCLAAHESNISQCNVPESRAVIPVALKAQEQAASRVHAKFVNVTPWICGKSACPQVVGNYDVYQDPFHLTSTYAEYLSPVLGIALGLLPATAGTG
jgi:SGNH domain (fused to AT3 domains)